ncbi:hypothetical protein L1N85_18610 [Paenibacillus alkaliterrae]|uniref:hypothetical protein n=1 Tax=Paenibacillus alkaliterrae TaxID=320909 RepID=UPI001F2882C9|nr:hypothetical protein [Paenibacillus alkaliterrae]MCF2940416.1 hypothetical protein [Paenibacillus alkaliterrae]
MISASDRQLAVSLIQEAVEAGAREKLACKELGLTQRTLQRWRQHGVREDGRPHAKRPVPAHKLSEEEEQQMLDVIHQPDFMSLPPLRLNIIVTK